MTSESERAKAIFLDVITNIPRSEWEDYVENACGTDQRVKLQVHELLSAHEGTDSFFDQTPAKAPRVVSESPGDTIGQYKLLQNIGEGGFGVVFMAEQIQPVRRKVALKVIKPGMDEVDPDFRATAALFLDRERGAI